MRVAPSAAGNDEPSAGFQNGGRAAQKFFAGRPPNAIAALENRRSNWRVEFYFARVHDMKLQVRKFFRRKSSSRELYHLRRGINAGGRTARQTARNFRRDFAVAATDIENLLVAAQIEFGDEFARPGLLNDGIRGVIGRVPFRRLDGDRPGHSLNQPRRFRPAAQDVHALDGLAARAFDDIILGAHHDEPARARVEPPRDFDDVRAVDVFCVRQILAVEQTDERFVAVIFFVTR